MASLANEKKFVDDYKNLLKRQSTKIFRRIQLIGFMFGMSQFIQFGVIGALFYAGAEFHIRYGGEAQDIFIAIFSMVLAAMSCGQAQQFGPDLGKAKKAAERIFEILDSDSELEQMTENDNEVQLINHEIAFEFKDVWFKYPSRQDQWILQDFNLRVRRGQSLGVVGPSGCGKSTLSMLLLRFYDPD